MARNIDKLFRTCKTRFAFFTAYVDFLRAYS
ncbi:hypothetical protein IWQ49_003904 [Labrenzia sp. EL_126]|nr:hypothetical protein [Labrenzia sp. EL_126]